MKFRQMVARNSCPQKSTYVGGGGGGFGPDPEPEWVDFDVHIPLDSKELDAEARRYLAKLEASMTPEQKAQFRGSLRKRRSKTFDSWSTKIGRSFPTECRVLDGSHVMGTNSVELEVLFKGRFSDVGLPGWSPA